MSQYKIGTVITNGTNQVTGSGTAWLTNASIGDLFWIQGQNAPYYIGNVNSDVLITLTSVFGGPSLAGQNYVIGRSFTANQKFPYPESTDIDTHTIVKRAMTMIDTMVGAAIGAVGQANRVVFTDANGNLTTNANLTYDGTAQKITAGDTAVLFRMHAGTARFRARMAVDVTNGSMFEFVNTAENDYVRATVVGNPLRLDGASNGVVAVASGASKILNIQANHATSDALQFTDTNGAPYATWYVGLGTGGGHTGLSFYRNGTGNIVILTDTGMGVGAAPNGAQITSTAAAGAYAFRGVLNDAGASARGISIENGNAAVAMDGNFYSFVGTNAGTGFYHYRGQSNGSIVFGIRGDGNASFGSAGLTAAIDAAVNTAGGGQPSMTVNASGTEAMVMKVNGTGSPVNGIAAGWAGIYSVTQGIIFAPSQAEKVRIAANGQVGINVTPTGRLHVVGIGADSQSGFFVHPTQANDVLSVWNQATSGNNVFVTFYTEGSVTSRGSITYNRGGGLVAYNTTSGADLKNIHGDADPLISLDILRALRMRSYSWKDDVTQKRHVGPVADELSTVITGAVSEKTHLEGMFLHKKKMIDRTAFSNHLVVGWQNHDARLAAIEQHLGIK